MIEYQSNLYTGLECPQLVTQCWVFSISCLVAISHSVHSNVLCHSELTLLWFFFFTLYPTANDYLGKQWYNPVIIVAEYYKSITPISLFENNKGIILCCGTTGDKYTNICDNLK